MRFLLKVPIKAAFIYLYLGTIHNIIMNISGEPNLPNYKFVLNLVNIHFDPILIH